MRTILHKQGITKRLTAPYTPEQNGGSEREMRTIVEIARTFRYSNSDVNYSAAIWAELVATAIYILNRTGKSSIEGKSPYELWFKKKSRIKHLRIIGCTCYAHIPEQRRRKIDKKATKGYLVVYDGDERYRIWVKESNKIIYSRNVIFQESIRECEEKVELPLKDNKFITLNEQCNKEGYEEETTDEKTTEETTNEKVTEETTDEEDDLLEHEESEDEKEEEEEQEDEDTEYEDQEKQESFSKRQLRDKSTLKKPKCFEDYIMKAETFINETENPKLLKTLLTVRKILIGERLGIMRLHH